MADASYAQTSFLGGLWSKYAQGRWDRPDYRTALNECLNAIPIEQGACPRRPGTQFAQTTRSGNPGRLIAFDFKASLPYLVEFTDGFLRFFNGPNLVTTNDDKAVATVSVTNPALVITSSPHGWVTGNQVKFANLGLARPLLQNRVFVITVTAASKFTLSDPITGITFDGTVQLGAALSGALVQRVLEVPSPYAGLWQDVRLVQAELQAVLLHPQVPPQLLTATPAGLSGGAFASFTLAPAVFTDGPYLDPPTNGIQVVPSDVNGNITLNFRATDWDATRAYTIGAFVLYTDGQNYISDVNFNEGNIPPSSPSQWTLTSVGVGIGSGSGFVGTDVGRMIRLLDSAGNWTWGQIIGLQSLIDPTGAGISSIGNMTSNGGTGAALDNLIFQASGACAVANISNTDPAIGYVGAHYATTAEAIDHGTLWPSTDLGILLATVTYTVVTTYYSGEVFTGSVVFNQGLITGWVPGQTVTGQTSGATGIIVTVAGLFSGTLAFTNMNGIFFTPGELIVQGAMQGRVISFSPSVFTWIQTEQDTQVNTNNTTASSVAVQLYAKATLPASAQDGTLLGETDYAGGPTTVTSGDSSTTWRYVWFAIVVSGIDTTLPANVDTRGTPAQGSTAYTQVFSLNSYNAEILAAEAQLFSPDTSTTQGNAISFQILGPALADTSIISTWALGLYSDTTSYPSCGAYHEGRLWLAGAQDNRIDASQSNDPFNFGPTETNGQVIDSDAIAAVFNATDVNPIFWVVPDYLGMIVGTQAGDWLIQASNTNDPITPTSIQVHRYSKMGCANIEPRRADHTLIVVQRYLRKLLEYFPDVFSGKFGAQNITWAMRNLTQQQISEIAYQQELVPVIWVRCGDGSLFGITYKRESNVSSQPPNFAAGHRHALGSGRLVESIAVGPSIDATTDSLAMVTNDPNTGVRHVEILASLFEENDSENIAWFLDDAVRPASTATNNTIPPPIGGLTINGLWHINNAVVTVFAGGLDCGDWQVRNGRVTVSYGDGVSVGTAGGLFTAAFAAAAVSAGTVIVGFTFTTQGQLVRPVTPQESGARNGPALGKKRRSMQIAALLDTTLGISFGTSFNKLFPANFRQPNDVPFAYGETFSGVYWTTLTDDYGYDSMICWQVTRPYSATVVAIEAFLQTQDK